MLIQAAIGVAIPFFSVIAFDQISAKVLEKTGRYYTKKLDSDFCVMDRDKGFIVYGYDNEKDARRLASKLNKVI